MTGPHTGEFRGEEEATEVWTGEGWMSYPFAREAEFSIFPANRRAMETDGRWARYLAYLAQRATA